MKELHCDILIVGGGLGGCAAAAAATALGKKVVLTEETDWLGGQLTSQAVPPDENPWIETGGCTRRYAAFRESMRQYYKRNHPLTGRAMRDRTLNPGGGYVSKLCVEPRVGVAALDEMLAPARSAGRLCVLTEHVPVSADADSDRVRSVTLRDKRGGGEVTVSATYILDATELGDLLPLAGVEYVSGAESQSQTGEPHAVAGDPQPDNVQAITWCFPLGYDPTPGADHTIDKPEQYDRWRNYVPQLEPAWPGKLLSWVDADPQTHRPRQTLLFPGETKLIDDTYGMGLKPRWTYRRIVNAGIFDDDTVRDVSLVNWPQNDYFAANLIDRPADEVQRILEEASQLSLSLLYWMQTEAPNFSTGGNGYPGLHLCPEIAGTDHGLAKAPYIRESRRIRAVFTVTENHVGTEARCGRNVTWQEKHQPDFLRQDWPDAEPFADSVGIGCYRIDLHMSTGGDNYVDISSLPFQIPLGALIPQRVENLLPACKNIGTTHITNGCYRLHPVEWNIGEAAGLLAAFCIDHGERPRAVRDDADRLGEFQKLLTDQGIPLRWKNTYPM